MAVVKAGSPKSTFQSSKPLLDVIIIDVCSYKPEDVAAKRMLLIMPLLEDSLDPSMIVELKKKIAEQNGVSYRSVSRYLDAFKKSGFEGLKPRFSNARNQSSLMENFDEIVDIAVELRRECPTRSVRDIWNLKTLLKVAL